MQHNRKTAAPARHDNQPAPVDFDFGHARMACPAQKKVRPGLVAGLVAFAFAVSMFVPVGAKAQAAWQLYPEQLTEPVRPAAVPEALKVESKRRDHPGWYKPHRVHLPEVCALQIDGRRGFGGYSENCLRQNGLREKLPGQCATNARIFGKRDRLYTTACLSDFGYRPRN